MAVKHLLKQAETYRSKRAERDIRPGWVTAFINEAAELFEPITGLGRVGFDCHLAEDCWVVTMYLGSTEVVGGKDDGQSRHTDFQFDLLELTGRFTEIDHFLWGAFPGCSGDSCIVIEGRIEENALRLQLFSQPPHVAGPGFRQYPDGHRETV